VAIKVPYCFLVY